MSTKSIKTVTQIESLDAETLLKKFDSLEKQINSIKSVNNNQSDKLITREQTAKLLSVSLVTIHNWTKSGILKAYRIGNKIRFKEVEVLQALQTTK